MGRGEKCGLIERWSHTPFILTVIRQGFLNMERNNNGTMRHSFGRDRHATKRPNFIYIYIFFLFFLARRTGPNILILGK